MSPSLHASHPATHFPVCGLYTCVFPTSPREGRVVVSPWALSPCPQVSLLPCPAVSGTAGGGGWREMIPRVRLGIRRFGWPRESRSLLHDKATPDSRRAPRSTSQDTLPASRQHRPQPRTPGLFLLREPRAPRLCQPEGPPGRSSQSPAHVPAPQDGPCPAHAPQGREAVTSHTPTRWHSPGGKNSPPSLLPAASLLSFSFHYFLL